MLTFTFLKESMKETIRFVVLIGCLWFILFVIHMFDGHDDKQAMCDIQTMECYDNLANH